MKVDLGAFLRHDLAGDVEEERGIEGVGERSERLHARLLLRVQGSEFRVQGPGFRVHGAGFRVQGSGFRVQGSGCRV